jgi:hypothetical protein
MRQLSPLAELKRMTIPCGPGSDMAALPTLIVATAGGRNDAIHG